MQGSVITDPLSSISTLAKATTGFSRWSWALGPAGRGGSLKGTRLIESMRFQLLRGEEKSAVVEDAPVEKMLLLQDINDEEATADKKKGKYEKRFLYSCFAHA